jgi:hypothetical protein
MLPFHFKGIHENGSGFNPETESGSEAKMVITRSMSKSMNACVSASTEASAEILGTEAEQMTVLRNHMDTKFEGEVDMAGCSWDFLS